MNGLNNEMIRRGITSMLVIMTTIIVMRVLFAGALDQPLEGAVSPENLMQALAMGMGAAIGITMFQRKAA
ncbi:hypothetical protein [Sphingomonas immobilis]|uniref:Uncharacterized protein n=1 Tax=Sphingomonas immobilis TaxID=3063997 RepID=A0ABT9A0X6_9SPHN|nr:hypothetical protein [Sphingomonas sp. CA1-15]MDO7842646.1 hypothetical protein [Sphingomonas sp. CA1-15]